MLSRNQAKAEEVIKDIKQISGNDLIQFCQLDLASFKSGTYTFKFFDTRGSSRNFAKWTLEAAKIA